MSTSDLSAMVSRQEHLPIAFEGRLRTLCWVAVVVLVVESAVYAIPTAKGDGGPWIVDAIVVNCLNVWGWGWLVLIVVVTAASVGAATALLSRGFAQAPAWIHLIVMPLPFIAALAAIPLILFVLVWLLVLAIYAIAATVIVACLFLLLAGALSS